MLILNGSTPTIVFLLVDSAGAPVTGKAATITALISKNGGAFVALTNPISEITAGTTYGKGWHSVDLTATETNTDGSLVFVAGVSGSLEWRENHQVYTSLTATIASTFTFAESAFPAAVRNAFADSILRRSFASASASSDGDAKSFRSLLGSVAKLVNKVAISGTTLSVYEADDATVLGTQTVGVDASADPITSLDTN